MTKKERALQIIERLKEAYPDAGCTLEYDQAWKLLVSVRLAAQCTDARVNVVVECGCAGGSTGGGNRKNSPSLRTGKQQGKGYQCLHENVTG